MEAISRQITNTVLWVLTKYPDTRANDNELVYQVRKKLHLPTDYEHIRHDTVNLNSSIERARRKLQQRNPFLRPIEQVSKRRRALEQKYREEMKNV